MCTIDWVIGEEEESVTGEEEEYAVKVQEVEEDREKDQFRSVLSTLTWLQPDSPVMNFTVGCRSNLFCRIFGPMQWSFV